MELTPINLIIWTFAVTFVLTAIITIGGIVDNFRFITIDKKYLNYLFTALIIEVVSGSVAIAASYFERQQQVQLVNTENLPETLPSDAIRSIDLANRIQVEFFYTGEKSIGGAGNYYACRTDSIAPVQTCGSGRIPVSVKRYASKSGGNCGYNYYAVACMVEN